MTDASVTEPLPPADRRRPRLGSRPVVVLFGTLVLGMVLGALLTGLLVRERFAALDMMRQKDGFQRAVVEAVDPTPEQQQAIAPILADAREGMLSNVLSLRTRMQTHMDSTLERLDVHLDDEQMEAARQLMRVEPEQEFRRQMPDDLRRRIEASDSSRAAR